MMKETTPLTKDVRMRRWFTIQSILTIILLVATQFVGPANDSSTGRNIILVVGLMIGFVLLSKHEEDLSAVGPVRRFFFRFNHYLQVWVQSVAVSVMLIMIPKWLAFAGIRGDAVLLLLLLAYIFLFTPMAIFALSRIESLVGRLLVLIFVVFNILVFSVGDLVESTYHYSEWVMTVANSDLFGALAFVVAVGIAMHIWGFKLPSFGWSKSTQGWVIALLVVVTVGYSIFNAFATGETWASVWTSFNFHMKSATLKMVLGGVEPGIAEEWLMRFAVLALLIRGFRHTKHQVGWAVFTSGIIFGLFHLPNMFGGQGVSATLIQVLSAGTAGFFFAALYLYTKAFWWPILFHIAVDSLEFVSTGTMIGSNPTAFDWQLTIVEAILFTTVSVFLITGERGRNVRHNFPELINND